MANKLKPLNPPFDEKVEALLGDFPRVRGELLSLFRTFANSARFLEKAVPNLLDGESPLPLREREIVILRTSYNLNCDYERTVHLAVFGGLAGFSREEGEALATEQVSLGSWTKRELCLIHSW